MLCLCATTFSCAVKNYPKSYPQRCCHFSQFFSDIEEFSNLMTDQLICIIHLWAKHAKKWKNGLHFGIHQNNPQQIELLHRKDIGLI